MRPASDPGNSRDSLCTKPRADGGKRIRGVIGPTPSFDKRSRLLNDDEGRAIGLIVGDRRVSCAAIFRLTSASSRRLGMSISGGPLSIGLLSRESPHSDRHCSKLVGGHITIKGDGRTKLYGLSSPGKTVKQGPFHTKVWKEICGHLNEPSLDQNLSRFYIPGLSQLHNADNRRNARRRRVDSRHPSIRGPESRRCRPLTDMPQARPYPERTLRTTPGSAPTPFSDGAVNRRDNADFIVCPTQRRRQSKEPT